MKHDRDFSSNYELQILFTTSKYFSISRWSAVLMSNSLSSYHIEQGEVILRHFLQYQPHSAAGRGLRHRAQNVYTVVDAWFMWLMALTLHLVMIVLDSHQSRNMPSRSMNIRIRARNTCCHECDVAHLRTMPNKITTKLAFRKLLS